MHFFNTSRIFLFCFLAVVLSATAQAGMSVSISSSKSGTSTNITTNRPWGNLTPFKPGMQYVAPPAIGSNPYINAAPGTGWYPVQQAATAPAKSFAPYVEVDPIDRGIYEQQNVILTARVVSSSNLKTLNPVLPNIEGAALEQIDGPVARERQTGHGREIINEYRFKLMPLHAGRITIPPISFTGTATGPATSSFTIAAKRPLTLHAFQANPDVKPWLPLHNLELRARLSQDGPVKAGTPVTLTLELITRGVMGNQLPSLQPQLQSDDFRAYRDSVTLSSGISKNGRELLGKRKETYTLIPLQDGTLYLPRITVAWWDVDTDTAMLAELVSYAHEDVAAGAGSTAAESRSSFFPVWFWAPLLVTVTLIAGFWLGAWARTLPLFSTALARLGTAWQAIRRQLQGLGRKLVPGPYINRLRLGAAAVMPRTVKLWMCTRCIESEDNPAAWCVQFRNRICQHLDIPTHTPLPVIAERLIAAAPQAEAASMRELVQSLDGAIYGTRPLDFPAWKRELRSQLRPRLFQRPRSRRRRTATRLPALNPHVA